METSENRADQEVMFEKLPPDVQRTIIDWCIKEKVDTIVYEKQEYILPRFVQITFSCRDCGQAFPVRVFKKDLFDEAGFNSKHRCPLCHKPMTIAHKSAAVDYSLIGEGSKDKHSLATFFNTNE
jgi:hypothetical protein